MAGKYLIAGLGNIGSEYAGTRHNIGFMVVDYLAEDAGAVFKTDRLGSIAEISYRGSKLILLKPSTYMNLSGKAVSYWLQKENIQKENLMVICDDLALPVGSVRMRKKGSDGGHNGLGNINQVLGTSDYCRIRVGIGNGFPRGGQVDYVLGHFEGEEAAMLPEVLKRAAQGVKDFTFMGADRAMNICNTDPRKNKPSSEPEEVKPQPQQATSGQKEERPQRQQTSCGQTEETPQRQQTPCGQTEEKPQHQHASCGPKGENQNFRQSVSEQNARESAHQQDTDEPVTSFREKLLNLFRKYSKE
ncbi:MAG: aminoacyl-tRNA hydrolase [Bacteroidales bacterium]|nr:aminoacyl-tRNA hydrolase [Bacteroidales bacterium]